MTRIIAIAAALLASATLISTTASAQSASYYSATPVTAPTKVSVITSGTLWKCTDGVCTAKKSTQRDQIMCQMVVQRVGALSAFTAGGTAFEAEALAKCNARAS